MGIHDLMSMANAVALLGALVLIGMSFMSPRGTTAGIGPLLLCAGLAAGACAFVRAPDSGETLAQYAVHAVWRDSY